MRHVIWIALLWGMSAIAQPVNDPVLGDYLAKIAARLEQTAPVPTKLSVTLTADPNPANAVVARPDGGLSASTLLLAGVQSEEQVAWALARVAVRTMAAIKDRRETEVQGIVAGWLERAGFADGSFATGDFFRARQQARALALDRGAPR